MSSVRISVLVLLCVNISLFISLSISAPVFAGSTDESSLSNMLESISQKILSKEKIEGNFIQHKHIHLLPQPLLSTGYFSFDVNKELIWSTITPIKSEMVFDDNGVRQKQNGMVIWEADKNQPGISHLGEIVRAILGTDWSTLRSHFSIMGSIHENQWHLMLTPKNEAIKNNILGIALSGEQYLNAMKIMEKDDNHTDITFTVTP